jgi:hypothetical protein
VSNATSGGSKAPETIEYHQELINLADIIKDPTLQVRGKVDDKTVKKYAEEMSYEREFPPIKLGRIDGQLLLIDGWHRLGAMQVNGSTEEFALVAVMTRRQALWEAAKPNLTHGLPLKPREKRSVFQAYVRSLQHRKKLPGLRSGSKLKSYREMGADLGVGHTTLRTWMQSDFPSVARELGGLSGNSKGTAPRMEDAQTTYKRRVHSALADAKGLSSLIRDAEDRHELLTALEELASELRKLPISAPEF